LMSRAKRLWPLINPAVMRMLLASASALLLCHVSAEYTPKIDSATFELWRLKVRKSVETTERAHRLQYAYRGQTVSPWHDIPFWAGYFQEEKLPLLHFVINIFDDLDGVRQVCEIPRMTHAKLEIHKGHEPNPLIQDTVGTSKLRFYKHGESIVNYGAIPQTWEDPIVADPDTGLGGDNDPIDVLQLNSKPCRRGAVQRVRILGALALVDGGETDWKLLVVNADDSTEAEATNWRHVDDVPEDRMGEIRNWFKLYKRAEGKPENVFSLDGRAVDPDHALRVARRTHQHWKNLVNGRSVCFTTCHNRECHGNEVPCWVGYNEGTEL